MTPGLALALLAVSLVVGLAALVRMAGPVSVGPDDVGGVIRLPAWLTGTVGALVTTAVLVFLVGLARRMRSRRGDGEGVLPPQAEPVPPWMRAVRQVLALVNVLVIAYLVWRGVIPLADMVALVRGIGAGAAGVAQPLEASTVAPPLVTWTYGAIALAAGLGALALAAWVAAGDRLVRWWQGAAAESESLPPLTEAVQESLEDLRAEPDARRAIVRCYARFQRVAADSGLPRMPWHTPMEFMREALSRLPVPRGALASLTGLFELARFSDRELGRSERQCALDALDEIRGALAERHGDAR